MRFRWLVGVAFGCGIGLIGGCGDDSGSLPREPDLQPVVGKVTVQGEPIAEAVVTFLQVDEEGTLSLGETDEDGNYVLTHQNRPGAAAAEYSVSISYLVGTDGTVYGLGPRGGLAKPYGMFSAKELIVPEWSDMGLAKHRVKVPEGGGVFDFDLPALLPPPEPDPEAEAEAEADVEGSGETRVEEPAEDEGGDQPG